MATTTFFKTPGTASCSEDPNNCYRSDTAGSCSQSCLGNTCEMVCYADIYYFTDPTDIDGNDWYAFVEVEDYSDGYGFDTSIAVDINTLNSLDVLSNINYGALSASSTTGAINASSTLQNTGNANIDVSLEGTDLEDGGSSSIPTDFQKYATSTFNYDVCPVTTCNNLSETLSQFEVDLVKPVSVAPVTDTLYWGIKVPFGAASSPHHGINTFYAVTE
jgi:hypothetical protein